MTVLTNARILDVREGVFKEGSLTLGDGKIASIDHAAGAAGAANVGDAIDLEGAYLLPGIITCHTHLSIVFPFHETDENESPAITALRCQKRANDALQAVLPPSSVATRLRAVVQVRKRAGCAPQ